MVRLQRRRLEVLRAYKNFAKEIKRRFSKRMELAVSIIAADEVFPPYIQNESGARKFLTEKENVIVAEFMASLGRSSLSNEQRRADEFILEINEIYEAELKEYMEKRKLNQSIGLLVGIFIAIILI